jgi:hypothetical protein
MEKFEVNRNTFLPDEWTCCDNLQVVRSIGSGSFGCALLCREKSSGNMVVIKQVQQASSALLFSSC